MNFVLLCFQVNWENIMCTAQPVKVEVNDNNHNWTKSVRERFNILLVDMKVANCIHKVVRERFNILLVDMKVANCIHKVPFIYHLNGLEVRVLPWERQIWVRFLFAVDLFPGWVIPVTYKLVLQWLPCQAPGVTGTCWPGVSMQWLDANLIRSFYFSVIAPTILWDILA